MIVILRLHHAETSRELFPGHVEIGVSGTTQESVFNTLVGIDNRGPADDSVTFLFFWCIARASRLLAKCSATELCPQSFSLMAAFFRLSKNEGYPCHHKEMCPSPPPMTWETIQPVLKGPIWAWGHLLGVD